MLTVDFDRLGVGPGTKMIDVGAGAGQPLGELARHDVHQQHPAAGAVVHAAPGLDLALPVPDHDVLAGA